MPRIALFALLCGLALPAAAAPSPAAEALAAVLGEENLEIIHAEALPDGVVEIIFGVSVTDDEVMRVVDALRGRDAIKDVIARTSPRTFCQPPN